MNSFIKEETAPFFGIREEIVEDLYNTGDSVSRSHDVAQHSKQFLFREDNLKY